MSLTETIIFSFFALMSLTETLIFSFLRLCRWQKRLFSLFHAYVVDRNTYFLFFALMSLTETIIFSFSCLCRWQKLWFSLFCSFWNVQKHKKPPFTLSETFRSMKNLHLFFLKRSEAQKTSICSFWNVQKHEKPPFGLSEMFRSMKILHLLFLKCSEAWKTSICSFWNVQKHENKKIICKITIQSLFLYANEDLLNLEIPHGTQEWYEMSHKLTHDSSTHYAYELLYKGAWEI